MGFIANMMNLESRLPFPPASWPGLTRLSKPGVTFGYAGQARV